MLELMQAPARGQGPLGLTRTFLAMNRALQAQPVPADHPAAIVQQLSTGRATLEIRRATVDDLDVILGMIDEAKQWLRTKGTDQWSRDWLDKDGRGRGGRVEISVKEEATWLVWFSDEEGEVPVATVTIDEHADPYVWADPKVASQPAAYLSRLVTARKFSGLNLGAALIKWSCAYVAREYHAKFIRIDVWTDNYALHRYYENQGFESCGECPYPEYPSRALFQKATPGGPARIAAQRALRALRKRARRLRVRRLSAAPHGPARGRHGPARGRHDR